ncbi:MAG: glycogen/starch/alpha-glucan phosphorylase, partial [Moorea sp. SIO2I5]|nr:glycogen/starch/alpha-glucan phosphorylase [Moorena sp. SIO2I5]
QVIDQIGSRYFYPRNPKLFKPLVDSLLYGDEYLLLADYQSYVNTQKQVSQAYRDQHHWTRMSIINAANMGKFSSDRTIREYGQNIWNVEPISVDLDEYDQDSAGLKRVTNLH